MTKLLWTDIGKYDFSDLAFNLKIEVRSVLGLFVSYMHALTKVFFHYNDNARACLLCHVKTDTKSKFLLTVYSIFSFSSLSSKVEKRANSFVVCIGQ